MAELAEAIWSKKQPTFETAAEANLVTKELIDRFEDYQQVTVADLLFAVNKNPVFKDTKWGWLDRKVFKNLSVKFEGGMYQIDLPAPFSII